MSANAKALELAMINVKKGIRVETQLNIDRQKILRAELNELYADLGKMRYAGDSDCIEAQEIIDSIQEKETALETYEPSPNDATDISELVTKLSDYIVNHIAGDAEGTISEQIYPLMGRVVADALSTFIGPEHTALLFLSRNAKSIILYSMTVGFMLYNLLKTHGLTIVTKEFEVDKDYIDELMTLDAEQKKKIEDLIFGGGGDVVDSLSGLGEDDEEE